MNHGARQVPVIEIPFAAAPKKHGFSEYGINGLSGYSAIVYSRIGPFKRPLPERIADRHNALSRRERGQ